MSEKLTKADELCEELAETLSLNPDTVEITIKIPQQEWNCTTTVTNEEIAQMAAGELFHLDRRQTRIERESEQESE